MVAVLHAAQEAGAPQTVAAWLDTLRGVYPDEDCDAFEAVLAYARERCGATRGRDGEPLIDRAVGAAMILAGLKLDAGTVRAALLTGLAGANAFAAEDIVAEARDDLVRNERIGPGESREQRGPDRAGIELEAGEDHRRAQDRKSVV